MKTILVTGGAGFLGSHLVNNLLSDGHKVIVMDNLQTGSKDNLSPHVNLEFIQHDVTKPYKLLVDEVYNLACAASPPAYMRDPYHTILTSVLGIKHALELPGSPKIFQASTSEVYGDPTVSPQPESYWGNVNPNGIRSCYDEGKRLAETMLLDHSKQYGTRVKIARIFNTYGPGMQPDDGRVVTNFINQALNDEPITIYGEGQQTRSFCYVDDLIAGFRILMDKTPDDFRGPMNIGNPNEFTISELAHLIIGKLPNTNSPIVYKDLPSDDPKQRCPDISLAKSFGWEPKILLSEGLNKTINYFKGK